MTKPGACDVAICIASYCRPEGLFALLGALDGQTFEGPAPSLRIVVVDNDPRASARAVCADARTWLRHPLRYLLEKRRGIPMARNAALGATWDARWIAFIDDDETPEPDWLDTLLRKQRESGADVVAGPVLPRFQQEPPPWVTAGGFLEHAPLGADAGSARTGNLLVRAGLLARLSHLFDERMTPVGEDRELFERVALAGGRFEWAPNALVVESVPPERATLRWILQRGFRVGVASSRIAVLRSTRLRAAPRAVAHGLWCLLRGLAQAATAPVRGRAQGALGLRLAAFGVGRLLGVPGPVGVPLRNQGSGIASA